MEYEIIRSARKTLSVEIKNGRVRVRAPLKATDGDIARFVVQRYDWIEKHLARTQPAPEAEKLTMEEIRQLADKALEIIPERVRYYAPLIGVSYGRITIRNQRTKWGSCSGKGNLNFNCLLMLTPPEVLDSVVVHELCHLKHMNHSKDFYAEVLRVFPSYREAEKWLKENGNKLISRMVD